jgi:hypothetical protein
MALANCIRIETYLLGNTVSHATLRKHLVDLARTLTKRHNDSSHTFLLSTVLAPLNIAMFEHIVLFKMIGNIYN